MEIVFIALILIVFYTYIGYGILLFLMNEIKAKKKVEFEKYFPEATFLICAYNEASILDEKIKNTLNLDYPKDKLKIAIVTDGSDDNSMEIIKKYPGLIHFHSQERKGKIHAVNRVIPLIKTAISIFSDANVMLNPEAVSLMTRRFMEAKVAAVSGEKVILESPGAAASSAGEGMYWKYESFLKKLDARLNTLVGSAGELFAIRTNLFESIDTDTIIEDFYMTMKLASKGYKVDYEPAALAGEYGSLDICEEKKRKVRIAAGGIQAIVRLKELLKFWKHPFLSFQYISHRVLRWTLTPLALFLILPINIGLIQNSIWYQWIFLAQLSFYLLAFIGFILRSRSIKYKVFYIPFYFIFMNVCVVQGWIRFFRKTQKVTWETSKRIVIPQVEIR